MSGGHFEYKQYNIEEIAREIDRLIRENNDKDEFGYSRDCSPETLEKFRLAAETCRRAAGMAQRVDWLVSSDDSEETFHERWKEDGLE